MRQKPRSLSGCWNLIPTGLFLLFLPFFSPGEPTSSKGSPYPAVAGQAVASVQTREVLGDYVMLGWNDLGMHCMNRYYSQICVLPPFNNLWAQVIRRGSPPQLINQGVILSYRFPSNSTSSNKVDFWTYAEKLFGVQLAPDTGLTGHALTGILEYNGTAWEATGIPITPFEDAQPTIEQPYQLAEVSCRITTQTLLDKTMFVAPVSTEIHCDDCHGSSAEVDILTRHDKEHNTALMANRPILCGSCHASNALGTPGAPNVPNLSRAIHKYHGEEEGPNTDCYHCHPGRQTQCLRGAMYKAGKTCVDCHGDMLAVGSSSRRPWIDEPKCATCHADYPEEAGKLYRNSRGHGGLYCIACHNSPHSEWPTVQERDSVQPIRVQGQTGPIKDCYVCHKSRPTSPGPHGLVAPPLSTGTNWILK